MTKISFQTMGRLVKKSNFVRPHFKVILALIILLVILTISIWVTTTDDARKCFMHRVVERGSIVFLADVIKSEKKPQYGKSIFFHETSCSSKGLVQLNAR